MDNQSYEQYPVSSVMLGGYVNYLKPNDIYQLLVHDEDIVGILVSQESSPESDRG